MLEKIETCSNRSQGLLLEFLWYHCDHRQTADRLASRVTESVFVCVSDLGIRLQ